jgi:hypothetical protein
MQLESLWQASGSASSSIPGWSSQLPHCRPCVQLATATSHSGLAKKWRIVTGRGCSRQVDATRKAEPRPARRLICPFCLVAALLLCDRHLARRVEPRDIFKLHLRAGYLHDLAAGEVNAGQEVASPSPKEISSARDTRTKSLPSRIIASVLSYPKSSSTCVENFGHALF